MKGSRARRGMGGHETFRGETNEWYTPPALFEALGVEFDLDPCSPPGGLPWIPARRFLSVADDGLATTWQGRVWMNPPYGEQLRAWMRRLAAHGDGIALVFARTDTAWFQEAIPAAHAVCFIARRLTFVRVDGAVTNNAGAPSCLIAYGQECAEAVAASGLGVVFSIRAEPAVGQGSLFDTA